MKEGKEKILAEFFTSGFVQRKPKPSQKQKFGNRYL
jgi:hypothetical protein